MPPSLEPEVTSWDGVVKERRTRTDHGSSTFEGEFDEAVDTKDPDGSRIVNVFAAILFFAATIGRSPRERVRRNFASRNASRRRRIAVAAIRVSL